MKDPQSLKEDSEKCPWCGHVRCNKCLADRWLSLADGCCQCRRRFVMRIENYDLVRGLLDSIVFCVFNPRVARINAGASLGGRKNKYFFLPKLCPDPVRGVGRYRV